MTDPVAVSPPVRDALACGVPVVALESTLFTHGLPRPRNLVTALEAERRVRGAGAVPATVAVVAGVPTVGLDEATIERLATADDVAKLSTRELPIAMAPGRDGGTTVAATAFLAHRAGIAVFATGGLGGVHHGATTSFDESADLPALAGIPIVVVSAGVKSVLDIGATLERLETLGIPVVGYRTSAFPGFYVADSGHRVLHAVDGPGQVADLVAARNALGLRSALLVANPVPVAEQLDPRRHDEVLIEAWAAATRAGVVGQDTTPFLLDHIRHATGGASLEVNVAAYRHNVDVAAAIAAAIAGL